MNKKQGITLAITLAAVLIVLLGYGQLINNLVLNPATTPIQFTPYGTIGGQKFERVQEIAKATEERNNILIGITFISILSLFFMRDTKSEEQKNQGKVIYVKKGDVANDPLEKSSRLESLQSNESLNGFKENSLEKDVKVETQRHTISNNYPDDMDAIILNLANLKEKGIITDEEFLIKLKMLKNNE